MAPTQPIMMMPFTTREEFLTELEEALHHGNAPVALALSDLDNFRELNDEYGSGVGDQILALWEQVLRSNLPPDAKTFRLGGDEYVAILPTLSAENALIVFDEIRHHFSGRSAEFSGRTLSASLGIAANPPHGNSAEMLWQAAGQALMRAKRDGGDRIAIYVEEKMILKSNYYSRANLERLAKLSSVTNRTEASLLREALDDLVEKFRERT
jgi:diguanylate cyclase